MKKRLLAGMLSALMLLSMLPVTALAEVLQSVSVSFDYDTVLSEVSGASMATPGEAYTVTVTPKTDVGTEAVTGVYADIKTGVKQLNQDNGTTSTLLRPRVADVTDQYAYTVFEVKSDLQDGLPGGSKGYYSLSYAHAAADVNTNAFMATTGANLFSGKPEAVGFGFWIHEESIASLGDAGTLDIWPSYVGKIDGTKDCGYRVYVPVKALCEDIGHEQLLSAEKVGQAEDYITAITYKAACLEKQGEWYFICLNGSNITYAEDFEGKTESFYICLPIDARKTMKESAANTVDLCGLTLVRGSVIESADHIYGDGITTVPMTAGADNTYTLPGNLVTADFTVRVTGRGSHVPRVTGVNDGANYAETVTPQCADTDIAGVSLTCNGAAVTGYALGTAISAPGAYVLTVTNRSGNATVVSFRVQYEYAVTKVSEGITIDGGGTADSQSGYSFTLTPAVDGTTLGEAYMEYAWNGDLVVNDDLWMSAYVGSVNSPTRKVNTHTDLIGGIWDRSLELSYNPEDTAITEQKSSVFLSEARKVTNDLPGTIAIGFWVNTQNLADLFGESGYIEFWPAYTMVNGKAMNAQLKLNLKALVDGTSSKWALTPTNNSLFKYGQAEAACIARDGEWAYITLNLTNLAYADGYVPGEKQSFYLTLNGIPKKLYETGKSLEIAGLTVVTGSQIHSAGMQFSQGEARDYLMDAVLNIPYTIAPERISGDFTLYAYGNDNTAPVITGVADGAAYEIGDALASVIPASADTDIRVVVLTRDGVEVPFKLGDALSRKGAYELTVADNYGNTTKVSFTLVSVGKVDVTQDLVYVTTDLTGEATRQNDLSFNITLTGADNGVQTFNEGYATIADTNGVEFAGELLAASAGSKNSFAITNEASTAPTADIWPEMQVLSYQHEEPGNSNNYHNYSTTAWKGKPTEASLSFWISDESVEKVFDASAVKSLYIWLAYQSEKISEDKTRTVSSGIKIPLVELCAQQGNTRTLSFTTPATSGEAAFTSGTVTATCLVKENGWSYVVVNLTELIYNDNFKTDNASWFYFLLNDQKTVMNADAENVVKISGLSLVTGATRSSAAVKFPTTAGGALTCYFRPKTAKAFTIPGEYITGDVNVTFKASLQTSEHYPELNVTNDAVYNPSVTPTSADPDIAAVTLTRKGAAVAGYALGTAITEPGEYTLTVTNYDGYATTVSFEVRHAYTVAHESADVTIAGSNKADSKSGYSFTLTAASETVTLDEVYMAYDWTGKIVISDDYYMTNGTGSENSPAREVKTYTDPIGGIWDRSLALSYNDQIAGAAAGKSVYMRKELAVTNDTPTSIAIGFWVNTENLEALFGSSGYVEFWPAYSTTNNAILSLNLHTLVQSQGTSQVKSLSNTLFKSGRAEAACIAVDGNWAYITLNLTDLKYADGYTPGAQQAFYLTLNGISKTLYNTGKSLEIAGLTVVAGSELHSAVMQFSEGEARDYLMDVKFGEAYTIAPERISGDFTLHAYGNDHLAPVITGVADGVTYQIGDENPSVTPNSAETDIGTVTLTRDGVQVPYQLGQPLSHKGAYVLTVADRYGNEAVIRFTLVSVGAVAITQELVYVTTDLPAETIRQNDLTFNVTLTGAANGITAFNEGYAAIAGTTGVEHAGGILTAGTSNENNFSVKIVESDGPFKDTETKVLTYDYAGTTNGTNNFRRYETEAWSGKPTEASMGFWISDESVEKVFKPNNQKLIFWLSYQQASSTVDKTTVSSSKIEIPVVDLCTAVGTTRTLNITKVSDSSNNTFTTSTVTASCLVKENGWSYVVVNMTGLTYENNFNAAGDCYFYVYLNNVKTQMTGEGTPSVKLSGLSLVAGATRLGTEVRFPTTAGGNMTYYFRPKTGTQFTIPGEYVTGDIAVTFKASSGAGTASVAPETAAYDKSFLNRSDVVLTVSTDGDVVEEVLCNNVTLKAGRDYTTETTGTGKETKIAYTLMPDKLNGLAVGEHTITFVTGEGNNPAVKLTVTDTTEVDETAAVQVYSSGTQIYVRTAFSDTEDLVQAFTTYTDPLSTNSNAPMNFSTAKLIGTEAAYNVSGKAMSGSGDEATPFNLNSSYIGANHGQDDGKVVTAANHGKTYADVGSQWRDANGVVWDLLRVVDGNTLWFLKEDTVEGDKYNFTATMAFPLTCVDGTGALHDEAITDGKVTKEAQQVTPAIGNVDIKVYAVKDGQRYLLGANASVASCDYVVIEEYYDIIDPSTIAQALRENRPAGGYTEQPYLGVGEPMISYHMTHQILADGTVLEIMDHTINQKVNMGYYGGIQYQQKNNAFGGGVYRYLPGTKNLTVSVPFRVDGQDVTGTGGSIQVSGDYLADRNFVPDRQLDHMRDTEGNNKVSFAGGYLPLGYNETPAIRKASTTDSSNPNGHWGFLYKSNKVYPSYVRAGAGDNEFEDQKITGVAYKKYFSNLEDDVTTDSSWYTVEYNGVTYLYYDRVKSGTDVITLAPELMLGSAEVVYVSGVTYEQKGDGIHVTAGTDNAYLALKLTPTTETIHTVTFQADEAAVKTFYVLQNGSLEAADFPAVPEKTGYTAAWSRTTDITGVTADVTVTAVYTAVAYTITYELNDGTAANPATYTIESVVTLAVPTRDGCIFLGWTGTDLTGLTQAVTIPAGQTGARTYTANWQFETPSLAVTQPTVLGGKGSIATTTEHQISTDGETWTDSTGVSERDAGTYYVRVKATDTALASEYQTIIINAFTGTAADTPNAAFSAVTMKLTGVTSQMQYRIGSSAEWTAISGTEVDLSEAVTDACTIQIQDKGNGSTTTESAIQEIRVTKAATPDPAVTLPIIKGGTGSVATTAEHQISTDGETWTDCTGETSGLAVGTYYVRVKASGTVLASEAKTILIDESMVPPTYTVTFDPNGGSVSVTTVETDAQGKLAALPVPVRSGYVFNGWYTAANGGVRVTENTVFTADTVVYAQWTLIGGGSYTPGKPVTYAVTVTGAANGDVIVSHSAAGKGTTVIVTVLPDAGYELGVLSVTDARGSRVALTDLGGDRYSFVMPDGKVTVSAYFAAVEKPVCNGGVGCAAYGFADVDTTQWYHEAVDYVIANGLMNGTGTATFEPLTTTTRAMIVTILYRLEGSPAVYGADPFNDLTQDWYVSAVRWAAANGIVEGCGDGKFGPEDVITREQLATILYRYAAYKGYALTADASLAGFVDAGTVSPWAEKAMSWAYGRKIVNGTGAGRLAPSGDARRCEAAAMLMRFIEGAEA